MLARTVVAALVATAATAVTVESENSGSRAKEIIARQAYGFAESLCGLSKVKLADPITIACLGRGFPM